eukprot:GEZU01028005.1.p1 GENE.GEZU01028005.1~~GEZU01028005.1.p1  ORF type:complete len:109 (-),score=30.00 GEZU01028005.1:135-461(-)
MNPLTPSNNYDKNVEGRPDKQWVVWEDASRGSFAVIVNQGMVDKYRKEKEKPNILDVVQDFQVFRNTRGEPTHASKALLEEVFGTRNLEEICKFIVEKGTLKGPYKKN